MSCKSFFLLLLQLLFRCRWTSEERGRAVRVARAAAQRVLAGHGVNNLPRVDTPPAGRRTRPCTETHRDRVHTWISGPSCRSASWRDSAALRGPPPASGALCTLNEIPTSRSAAATRAAAAVAGPGHVTDRCPSQRQRPNVNNNNSSSSSSSRGSC